jgi:acetylornithine deacetylase/succinyl-diaminopimelate desuccinylase-like protein
MSEGLIEDVFGRIDESREDLADLALTLGNTYGPLGNEEPTARRVYEWYRDNGMEADLVPMIEGRASVVGRLRGDGTGRSLIFNAHLDTEASGPDYDRLMNAPDPNLVGARREGDHIIGHTVQNDRGCMSVQMVAGRAISQAGAALRGDVLLKSAAGETGAAPVDEYEGMRYESKGLGTTWLVDRGYTADYAVIAETTDFSASWVQCGATYFKVSLSGRNMYTPRLVRTDQLADHPNAIVRAAAVIQAIESWAVEFEARRTTETSSGTMAPKAQVGAMRGGLPWRPNRSSTYAALYVDVRTLPGEDVGPIHRELTDVVRSVDPGAAVEIYMSKAGHAASDEAIAPLLDTIKAAHEYVRGEPMPARAETAVVSMWRDTNVYNGRGIPSLTFGPSRGNAATQGTGSMELGNMIEGTKIYALMALSMCGAVTLGA